MLLFIVLKRKKICDQKQNPNHIKRREQNCAERDEFKRHQRCSFNARKTHRKNHESTNEENHRIDEGEEAISEKISKKK